MPKKKKVKLLAKSFVTHDVKRFIVEKPEEYRFTPGQATMVAIDKKGLRGEDRPFTFTSLNKDEVLEFIIKGYYDHEGTTKAMHNLDPGEELLIGNPWGAINYDGEGVFIAGGAGITPFIAILRDLKERGEIGNNRLIFSNKKEEDIILQKELEDIFSENPDNLILTLTEEKNNRYENELVDKEFLKSRIEDFSQKFYVCGPPKMVEDIVGYLKELGADPSGITLEE